MHVFRACFEAHDLGAALNIPVRGVGRREGRSAAGRTRMQSACHVTLPCAPRVLYGGQEGAIIELGSSLEARYKDSADVPYHNRSARQACLHGLVFPG